MDVAEYELQLQQVELALSSVTTEADKAELEALKANLLELIELTKVTSNAHNDLENEMELFKAEIASYDSAKVDQGETDDSQASIQDDKLKDLEASLEKIVGQKCSVPHQHSWGAVAYHNAIVCGVEDGVEISEDGTMDVQLRVLFTNPTHREMLPCEYYLEGECRFDAERCHYSHGELVSINDLREYMTPAFERLARNCVVLAKLKDRLWHRGRVICANFVDKSCRVRLDSQEHKERERDFNFEDLFPMVNGDDEDEDDEDDDDDDNSDSISTDSEELTDLEIMARARLVEQSLFTFKPKQPLGEWEKHTRGIGSKLMSKMGYVHGTGLGSDGRGIVIPISAQILPQGRSLDYCMELREAANGDSDLFSVEKKIQQQKKKQDALNAKAYERESQNKDVFSFLNESILSQEAPPSSASGGRKSTQPSLKQHSTKELNVESVRLADDIRRKEREIIKVRESMKRNSRNVDIHKQLEAQLSSKSKELAVLQKEEDNLCKEKAIRKTKEKLTIF